MREMLGFVGFVEFYEPFYDVFVGFPEVLFELLQMDSTMWGAG